MRSNATPLLLSEKASRSADAAFFDTSHSSGGAIMSLIPQHSYTNTSLAAKNPPGNKIQLALTGQNTKQQHHKSSLFQQHHQRQQLQPAYGDWTVIGDSPHEVAPPLVHVVMREVAQVRTNNASISSAADHNNAPTAPASSPHEDDAAATSNNTNAKKKPVSRRRNNTTTASRKSAAAAAASKTPSSSSPTSVSSASPSCSPLVRAPGPPPPWMDRYDVMPSCHFESILEGEIRAATCLAVPTVHVDVVAADALVDGCDDAAAAAAALLSCCDDDTNGATAPTHDLPFGVLFGDLVGTKKKNRNNKAQQQNDRRVRVSPSTRITSCIFSDVIGAASGDLDVDDAVGGRHQNRGGGPSSTSCGVVLARFQIHFNTATLTAEADDGLRFCVRIQLGCGQRKCVLISKKVILRTVYNKSSSKSVVSNKKEQIENPCGDDDAPSNVSRSLLTTDTAASSPLSTKATTANDINDTTPGVMAALSRGPQPAASAEIQGPQQQQQLEQQNQETNDATELVDPSIAHGSPSYIYWTQGVLSPSDRVSEFFCDPGRSNALRTVDRSRIFGSKSSAVDSPALRDKYSRYFGKVDMNTFLSAIRSGKPLIGRAPPPPTVTSAAIQQEPQQPTFPTEQTDSNTNHTTQCGYSGVDCEREVLIVDVEHDKMLAQWVEETSIVRRGLDTELKALHLCTFVSHAMGGFPIEDHEAFEESIREVRRGMLRNEMMMLMVGGEKSEQPSANMMANVVPLGAIRKGLCRHRALLLKCLAEQHNVPMFLVRGEYVEFSASSSSSSSSAAAEESVFPHVWCACPLATGVVILDPTLSPTKSLPYPNLNYRMDLRRVQGLSNACIFGRGESPPHSRHDGHGQQQPQQYHPLNNKSSSCSSFNNSTSSTILLLPSLQPELREECGFGATGRVHRMDMGSFSVAVKRAESDAALPSLRREFELMQKLQHVPGVPRVIGWCQGMLMEHFPTSLLGFMNTLIEKGQNLGVQQREDIARGLLTTLAHLHRQRPQQQEYDNSKRNSNNNAAQQHQQHPLPGAAIVHRDIKSENVMLLIQRCAACQATSLYCCDCGVRPYLIDFVDAVELAPGATMHHELPRVGTPPYTAPEVLSENPFNQAADMWSVGMLLLEMSAMELPSVDLSAASLMEDAVGPVVTVKQSKTSKFWGKVMPASKYCDQTVFVPESYWNDDHDALRQIVTECLQFDASRRITARGALSVLRRRRRE